MDIKIEIHTYAKELIYDLWGKDSLSFGDEVKITDKVKLKYNGTEVFLTAERIPEIIHFILTLGSGVACGLVANWLYGKIKGRDVEKLIIERTEVEIEQGEIKRVIEEKIRFKHE